MSITRYQFDQAMKIIDSIFNESVRSRSIPAELAEEAMRLFSRDRAFQNDLTNEINRYARDYGWRGDQAMDPNHFGNFISPFLEDALTTIRHNSSRPDVPLGGYSNRNSPYMGGGVDDNIYGRDRMHARGSSDGVNQLRSNMGGASDDIYGNRGMNGGRSVDDNPPASSRGMFDNVVSRSSDKGNSRTTVSSSQASSISLNESSDPLNTFSTATLHNSNPSWLRDLEYNELDLEFSASGETDTKYPITLSEFTINRTFDGNFDAFRFAWNRLPSEAKLNHWMFFVNYRYPQVVDISVENFKRVHERLLSGFNGNVSFKTFHDTLLSLNEMNTYYSLEKLLMPMIISNMRRYIRLGKNMSRRIELATFKDVCSILSPENNLSLAREPSFYMTLNDKVLTPVIQQLFAPAGGDGNSGVITPDHAFAGDYIACKRVPYVAEGNSSLSKEDIVMNGDPDKTTLIKKLTEKQSIVRVDRSICFTNCIPKFDQNYAIGDDSFAANLINFNSERHRHIAETDAVFLLQGNTSPSKDLGVAHICQTMDNMLVLERSEVLPGFA